MLLTKLHISPPGVGTVHRAELFAKLAAGLKTKLMLISAPAGFGKTTLVSDWIIQQNIPAAWYSIDDSDNDAAKFLSYIITAIQGLYPDFGENALKLLHSPNQLNQESIVQLLINEIFTFPKHFVLILDDFHFIYDQAVLNLLSYFIAHMPINIHLVILTRADPRLPIAKLRSQHQLVELRSADLNFSPNDIHFLFNRKLKLKLSMTEVESLAFKTEGWIAGLQLIALSLRGREDTAAFIQDFKGDNRYIMDYLIEEVLKIQTPETREFLLQTSLLEQLSAPLCNAVLERHDSQTILEMLENNNMFIVSLDAERQWYRYHHLFADLLKQRLIFKDKAVIKKLHNKASAWFEGNQMYPLAIEHLLQTQDYYKAIGLLTEITEGMWEKGNHGSILKYGELLPDEVIKKSPEFCLFYAWVLVKAGKIEKANPFLSSAEEITRQNITAAQAGEEAYIYLKKLTGKIAVAQAYQYSFLNKPEIILEYCRIALENLTEDDPMWFSWGWYVVGKAQLADEKLYESTESLKKALLFGKKSGNIYLITTIAMTLSFNEGRLGLYAISYKRSSDLLEFLKERGYGSLIKTDWTFAVLFANLAAIQYFRANLDDALDNIKIAYNLCVKEADITAKVLVMVIYSVVLHGRGDILGAERIIKEMDGIMQKNKIDPFRESMYIGWKAIFLITQKEFEKARMFLEGHGVGLGKSISYADEYRYIAFALLHLAENKIEDAFGLYSRLYDMVSVQNRLERMIEIKVFLSFIYQVRGEKDKALQTLTESLVFAAPDGILMYHLNFLDLIKPTLQEIFKNQATGKINLPQSFIHKLKDKIEKRKSSSSGNNVITSREQEALQLMAQNLSNQEIADKLFISLNTVKTRLKNLYVKLEVDNRTKAVAKAKELHLL
ncbi:LuxR C-terminal-related transcriptional regulator [soil metagenome]